MIGGKRREHPTGSDHGMSQVSWADAGRTALLHGEQTPLCQVPELRILV